MKKTFLLVFLLVGVNCFSQNNLLNFDGSSDYVDLGSNASTGVRTVEMWFIPAVNITSSSLTDFMTLVARNDAAQNDELNIVFYPYPFSNSGKLAFHRNIGGVIHYIESDNNTWSAGQCYHVSAVIDPVSGMKMYINGVLQGSTYTLTAAPNSAAEITTIGCFGDGYNRLFNGKIDEVRFWNYARSASEISNSYQHTVSTSSTGLIGYWNFDEGTGTVANDISPLNHDGNVVGATWTAVGGCVNAVSENNENLGFDFSIGPNPSSESAFLNFNSDFYSSFSIAIHDETGREVINKGAIKENLIQLNDFINLDSGLYFITVSVDDKPNLKITKRIIICK